MASKKAKAHTRKSKVMAKQGRYVLVIHMPKPMQVVLDRKKAKDESRSEYARRVVAKALKFKLPE